MTLQIFLSSLRTVCINFVEVDTSSSTKRERQGKTEHKTAHGFYGELYSSKRGTNGTLIFLCSRKLLHIMGDTLL